MSNNLKIKTLQILKKYKIKPQKRYGQNFLINENIIKKIILAAEITKEDTILEIGPGLGFLTKILAKKTKKVIAIEKDENMVKILKEELKEFKNIKIIKEDILKIKNLNEILENKKYKIVANLPYYITGPVIKKFLTEEPFPEVLILMVQKEVAQRIVAKSPKGNFLSNFIQYLANCKIISYIDSHNFFPKPKVNSAIIKIIPKKNIDFNFFKNFLIILKVGFLHPRKTIENNFAEFFKLNKSSVRELFQKVGIDSRKRAESLTEKEWQNILQIIKEKI